VQKGYFDFAKYGSIGISWVLSTSIYLYLGYKGGTYLDDRLESAPVFLLVGLLLAIGLSLSTLMTEVLALTKEVAEQQEETDVRAQDREKSNNSGPGQPSEKRRRNDR